MIMWIMWCMPNKKNGPKMNFQHPTSRVPTSSAPRSIRERQWTLRDTSKHFVTLRHGAHLAIQGLRGATLRRPRVFRRDMTRFAVVIVVGETPRSGDLGGSGAAVCALTCWLDRRSANDLTRMTRMAQVASPSKVLTLRISAACRDSCSFSMEIYGNQIRWWKF